VNSVVTITLGFKFFVVIKGYIRPYNIFTVYCIPAGVFSEQKGKSKQKFPYKS